MKIQRFFMLLDLFFMLNLLWEFLHYPLYNDFSGMARIPRVLAASFFDMIILSSIFLAISIKNRNLRWIEKPGKGDYAAIIILGIITAVAIEAKALLLGEWNYKKLMPTIFGIGLSPLIQLFTTAMLSLKIFNYLYSKEK